ncbi:hypothetical protein DFA_02940 [Cavenderia fasciculata]|uniref:Uncharacterized protein n=1 Tax=Cavenderia fasciculata TaxID=261658 RepID=F4PG62_CACFS|nr:uncharacterized protein DFA_02940 [Cavenderia fasciculata]EGG24696.1 hypothetical protein DFA_02940 [Cavenderia fasciculata]|eukprot:XP_004362547.1 hypothetical protein DFA_02940 [Cavenderia fasciculata]
MSSDANSATGGSTNSNNNNNNVDIFETRCQSQFLQSKIGTTYESIRNSFREAVEKRNSSKIQTCLQNLTYYKIEKDLLDSLLSVVSITDDKKVLRLAYYFLVELSQYKNQINSSADIKNITTIFSKEMTNKDISRKVVSLKTTAILAPNDPLVDANMLEVISGILRKAGEDPDKTQKKKGFFSKPSDLGRERALLQYACFVACRNRFKNNPSLFIPIVEGIKCADPVGARHAVALTYDYAHENLSTVTDTTKRFLPLLKANKGKEAVSLTDPFARRSFISLCGYIALTGTNQAQTKDFFQNICQSVMDNHLSVSMWAITTLCKFTWKTLESSIIESIIIDNDTPNHYDTLPNQTALIAGICNKLKLGFNIHGDRSTQQSFPYINMSCKLISALSRSYVKHSYPTTTTSGDGGNAPAVGNWQEQEKSVTGSINHPFSVLTSFVMSQLPSPSISIRIQALRALIWLCPSTLCPASRVFQDTFRAQLRDSTHPPHLLKELYVELYRRVIATPVLSPMVLSLIYDWIDIVPHKVDTSLVAMIWKTIIHFGREGRERVLQSIFNILDRSIHPDFRVVSMEIQKDIVQFLGDHANTITYETVASTTPSKPLNAIILRLEQYATFQPWQIRMTSIDSLAKIAFLSSTRVKIHIYNFLTTVPNDSHGWTSVKSNNSIIISILDQLLTLRGKWLPLLTQLSGTQKTELVQDHKKLTTQVGMFIDNASLIDYLPLGIETKALVK